MHNNNIRRFSPLTTINSQAKNSIENGDNDKIFFYIQKNFTYLSHIVADVAMHGRWVEV